MKEMATSSPLQKQAVEGYRLSPQQRRLWALQQKGLPCLSLCAVWMEGELDKAVLRRALAKLVRSALSGITRATTKVRLRKDHPLWIAAVERLRRAGQKRQLAWWRLS